MTFPGRPQLLENKRITMSSVNFVIEHLDDELFPWSKIEYQHMIEAIGASAAPGVELHFNRLPAYWDGEAPTYVKFHEESFLATNPDVSGVCVLDPLADEELSPSDVTSIRHFVFGGVLGNHPPDGRTKRELSDPLTGCIRRHLGPRQMTTDAALVTCMAVLFGFREGPLSAPPRALSALSFIDDATFLIGDPSSGKVSDESVEMPFRYPVGVVPGTEAAAATIDALSGVVTGKVLRKGRIPRTVGVANTVTSDAYFGAGYVVVMANGMYDLWRREADEGLF